MLNIINFKLFRTGPIYLYIIPIRAYQNKFKLLPGENPGSASEDPGDRMHSYV